MMPPEDDWTARELDELEAELERLFGGQPAPDEPEWSDDQDG